MNNIIRKYNLADPYMIEFAKDIRQSFITDQATFAAFDTDFGATFADDWQTTINNALNHLTDESVTDQQRQLTEAVEEAMTACRRKYQSTKYFIEKAFPDQPARWDEFGFNDYGAARSKQASLLDFMRILFLKATEYAAELAAVGYDAAQVTEIQALASTLDTANITQNKFKRQRRRLTHDRIAAYNAVWAVVTKVARVGKLVFIDSPAQYNEYLLPTTEERRELLSLTGRVADASTDEPITQAEATIEELAITVESDSNGLYGFGALPAGTYTLRVGKEGYATVSVADVVVQEGETTDQDVGLTATP